MFTFVTSCCSPHISTSQQKSSTEYLIWCRSGCVRILPFDTLRELCLSTVSVPRFSRFTSPQYSKFPSFQLEYRHYLNLLYTDVSNIIYTEWHTAFLTQTWILYSRVRGRVSRLISYLPMLIGHCRQVDLWWPSAKLR